MYFTALIGQSDGEWTSEEMDAAVKLGSLAEAFQNAPDWMEKVSTGELNTSSALAILNQLGKEEQMECLATCMVTMAKDQGTTESELNVLREILNNLNQGITEQEVINHCALLAVQYMHFNQLNAAIDTSANRAIHRNNHEKCILYDNSGFKSSSHILGYFRDETVYDKSGFTSSSHILAYCRRGTIYDNSGFKSSSHIIGYYKDGAIYDNSGFTSYSHILGYYKNGTLYDNSGFTSSSHKLGYYSVDNDDCAAALAYLLLF